MELVKVRLLKKDSVAVAYTKLGSGPLDLQRELCVTVRAASAGVTRSIQRLTKKISAHLYC